ncbi:MAG TPA: GNAT family N-acetyltransferase [Steroidobacteraceae bacterium]|nr:GNAT family N-acetyltransferase [Steroidobacteraceae bacterium]
MQIETARLILRPVRIEDFDAWVALMADAEAARFIGGPQPRSVAWRGFMSVAGAWHLTGCSMFSVLERETGRWVGRVGPWRPEGWPGPEVGWAIVRDCWGRGYATEAAVATIDWAFAALGWSEVIHTISPQNAISQRVAHKLGARNRGAGRLPPPFEHVAVDIWGQSRAEWDRTRAAAARQSTSR